MGPNFLVIGAGRCGTSTLCAYLQNHPDVYVSDPKEIGFFCEDKLYKKGWSWYQWFFRRADTCRAIGEGAVNYSKQHEYPSAAERVATHIPDAKIIYITRHPMEQIASNWSFSRIFGTEKLPFDKAVRDNPTYFATCDYTWQIDIYRSYFDSNQILVLFLEDLKADSYAFMNGVFSFLGVDSSRWRGPTRPVNAITDVRKQRNILSIVRELPGFYVIQQHIPSAVRRSITTIINKGCVTHHEVLEWDASTTELVKDIVEERAKQFLIDYGKPPEFWDFHAFRG